MRHAILPVVFGLWAWTCGSGSSDPTDLTVQLPADGEDVPVGDDDGGIYQSVETLLSSQVSAISDRRRLVIDDPDEWAAFWEQATQMLVPSPDLPAVEFSRDVVIAATMGARPTAGYAIVMEVVRGNRRRVGRGHQRDFSGANCLTAQILTLARDRCACNAAVDRRATQVLGPHILDRQLAGLERLDALSVQEGGPGQIVQPTLAHR